MDFERIENADIVEKLVNATQGKVTIYVVARFLRDYPYRLKFLRDCCVGLHGFEHEHLPQCLSQEHVISEAYRAYFNFFGFAPKGWRSPYLDFNHETLAALKRQGFLWDSSYKRSPITLLRRIQSPIRLIPIDARSCTIQNGTVMMHCYELTDKMIKWVSGRTRWLSLNGSNLVRHDEL